MKQVLLSFLLILTLAGMAQACPMCKDSIPNDEGAGSGTIGLGGPGGKTISGGSPPSISNGFNTSVYLMLGTLFSMIALISGVIYKGVSDSNRYNEAERLKAQMRASAPL